MLINANAGNEFRLVPRSELYIILQNKANIPVLIVNRTSVAQGFIPEEFLLRLDAGGDEVASEKIMSMQAANQQRIIRLAVGVGILVRAVIGVAIGKRTKEKLYN